MLDWLIEDTELLGLPTQNWMLLVGVILLIYIGVLAISQRRRHDMH